MAAPVRLAIASDIHAFSSADSSPSHLPTDLPENLAAQHPISALLELIRDRKLAADVLLSPGDLGHQADAAGIQYGWLCLSRLAEAMRCTLFTATAGNHDVDSRYKGDDHAPDHILKGLNPPYPFREEDLNDRYWARAYVINDLPAFRLVLLNSSAYHGNTPTEQNHGRIDRQTLNDLEIDLGKRGKRDVNVLMCHHHPHQHSELGLGEADVMKQGQLLLDLLGSGRYGRWLIIHGHKHHPKVSYAAGSSSSPVIFGAGSLTAALYPQLQTVARNQFYIIEIDPDECRTLGLVGRVKAWDWSSGMGWIDAGERSGLPAEFGFGCRTDRAVLANKVASHLGNGAPRPWTEILERVPELLYLIPQDWVRLSAELREDYGIKFTMMGSRVHEVGRMV